MIENDLYKRQSALNLNIPDKVVILGAGGIGSWVAMSLGLIGVKHLTLIDYDIIEKHNLNRTLYREDDIYLKKVHALTDLLMERREDIDITVFDRRVEDLQAFEMEDLKDTLIIDARDVFDELPIQLKDNPLIKLGYDGLSVTIILNPIYSKIWETEENRGYEIIPSFLAPCQFLATMLTTLITEPTFNMDNIVNKSINFNINEHFMGLI